MARKIKPYVTPLRKKWWAFEKKLPKWLRWYVIGSYHCDKCPMCWSEWSYEGDGDCGCFIFGDIREGACRLIPPIRTLIGWPKKKRAQYAYAHQYDGMGEWYEQRHHSEDVFYACIRSLLRDCAVIQRDLDGKAHIIPPEDYSWGYGFGHALNQFFWDYEESMYPGSPYISLKHEWRNVLARTRQELCSKPVSEDPQVQIRKWKTREKKFSECLVSAFKNYEIVHVTESGMMIPVCKYDLPFYMTFGISEAVQKYDKEAHPVVPTTLKDDWKRVLKRTWDIKIKDKIMPYFSK